MQPKILVVEDDAGFRADLCEVLEAEGYTTISASNGLEALAVHQTGKPDLILMDVQMPEMSGYEACKQLRKKSTQIPIIFLSGKNDELDKVLGLEIGADDYITKPFELKELLARIRASLRRARPKTANLDGSEPIAFGDITINPKTLTGAKSGKDFEVSKREIRLIKFFLQHKGEALSRDTILQEVWDYNYSGTTRTLDQHIAKLRQKIESDPANPQYIKTVHTLGYLFDAV